MTDSDYLSNFFEVSNIEEAKQKILTPENGVTTEERWQKETIPLVNMLLNKLQISEGNTVIDYGCGIGRISKDLLEKINCTMVGVDISKSMRALAEFYCNSETFMSCSTTSLKNLTNTGFRANQAFCIWVLQHAEDPLYDLHILHDVLLDGGHFLVLNLDGRCLPTTGGWKNDNINVKLEIEKIFKVVEYFSAPKDSITDLARLTSFCGLFQKR